MACGHPNAFEIMPGTMYCPDCRHSWPSFIGTLIRRWFR